MENYPSHDIFDSLIGSVLVTDADLKLQYMNQSAEELLGNSLNRVKNQPIQSIFSIPGLDKHIKYVVSSQQSHLARENLLTVSVSNSSKEFTVDSAITPIYIDQKFNGLLFEIHKVGRQLRIARETRLINTQATNQSVIRGIAHEIKNPLGGLRGAAQLLEMEITDVTLKEYTQIIISEADRLTKLVDSMLGTNQPLEKEEINIHQVLEHARQVIEVKHTDSFEIDTNYDPSIPPFKGDRDKLIQVALNLLNNAVKSLEKNGRITIKTRVIRNFTIRAINHPLVLCVKVIDNGTGIPADLQEEIFYPMISGHADGTGLGLSISQTIINQHNGLIEFISQPGKTEFSVMIPIEQGSAHPDAFTLKRSVHPKDI